MTRHEIKQLAGAVPNRGEPVGVLYARVSSKEQTAFRAPSFRFFQIGEAFLTETSTQIIVPTSIT